MLCFALLHVVPLGCVQSHAPFGAFSQPPAGQAASLACAGFACGHVSIALQLCVCCVGECTWGYPGRGCPAIGCKRLLPVSGMAFGVCVVCGYGLHAAARTSALLLDLNTVVVSPTLLFAGPGTPPITILGLVCVSASWLRKCAGD
jgi:hypothetical protein